MQQHRVVCTDSFEEPAVGAIYVTNFRIIFNGSPISVRMIKYIYMAYTIMYILKVLIFLCKNDV